jgi:hypothetical protein
MSHSESSCPFHVRGSHGGPTRDQVKLSVRRREDLWGSVDTAPPFLTWAVTGGEWSDSRTGRFAPGERGSLPIVQEVGLAP